jgi:HPt (histidine-containing phosphotransfer) domain-containing protein
MSGRGREAGGFEAEFEKLRATLGDALVAKMIDRFLVIGPERLREATTGAEKRDLLAVEGAAYSLVSNAGSLCAGALANLAKELQTVAAQGDVDSVRAKLPALEAEFRRRIAQLRSVRKDRLSAQ